MKYSQEVSTHFEKLKKKRVPGFKLMHNLKGTHFFGRGIPSYRHHKVTTLRKPLQHDLTECCETI